MSRTTRPVRAAVSLVLALALMLACFVMPAQAATVTTKSGSDGYYNDLYRRYYYVNLTEKEKKAYRNIVAALPDMPMRIEIPEELTEDELSHVMYAVSYDNPEFFMLSHMANSGESGGKYYYIPIYLMTSSMYRQMKKTVDSKLAEIVKLANLQLDTYGKILVVHDYLADYADYTYNGQMKYCVYGCLGLKQCNCEGYSRTNQLVLNALGIENHLMIGDGFTYGTPEEYQEGPHMWNNVTCDGKDYNVDITWDDITTSITIGLLRLPQGFSSEPSHIYFMRSSAAMKADHKAEAEALDGEKIWANCTDDTRNYYRTYGFYITKWNKTAQAQVYQMLTNVMNGGGTTFEVMFATQEAYEAAYQTLVTDGGLSDKASEVNSGALMWGCVGNEGQRVISAFLKYNLF